MCVNVELVYARGIAYPLVHNQFVNKGSQWVMLKRTVVSTYAYNLGPCEQTFVAFSNHVDKKHLSLTKLCSILQELTQYQASGIE